LANTDFYAKHNGSTTADCLSIANACTIERAISLAAFKSEVVGGVCNQSTLNLIDGTYTGVANMLRPGIVVPGKGGISGCPLIVKAINDGAVTLNGQFVNAVVRLIANSWWQIEGFNAHSAIGNVIHIADGSNNNIFRRIIAWDSHIEKNSMPWAINSASNNLIEDCAGFGTGRKTVTSAFHFSSNNNTWRRCWFRWEGGTSGPGGPKFPLTLAYNGRNTKFEDVLVTTSGESMPQTYYEWIHATEVYSETQRTNFQITGYAGLVNRDRTDDCIGTIVRGMIAYIPAQDGRGIPRSGHTVSFGGSKALFTIGDPLTSCWTLENVFAVISPLHPDFSEAKGFSLGDSSGLTTASRMTSVTGLSDTFHADWVGTNRFHGTALSLVPDPWTTTSGANLCLQTGSTTPLWPWPMRDRIKAATSAASSYSGPCGDVTHPCAGGRLARVETDVQSDIEALLGPIPSPCLRTTIDPPTFPLAPDFPSTVELDAFGDSGMAGWVTMSGVGWTEASGVATAPAGTSAIRFDTLYGHNIEAWAEVSGLPVEGGASLDIHFFIQDLNNRYRLHLGRPTGANNDTMRVTKLSDGVSATIIEPVSLGLDIAIGDKFGLRVLNNTLFIYFFDASGWGIGSPAWRRIATSFVSDLPTSGYIGMTGNVASITSFGGGNIAVQTRKPAPSRPVAPSRPLAPGAA
jgi:hypothetical protein